jgi:hypothetical protein
VVTVVGVVIGGATPAFAALPDAPAAPTAIPYAGAVAVQFMPPADDGGSAITSYTATCTPELGGTFNSVTQPAPTSTPITILVDKLTNGAAYTCTVLATNADGPGASSPPSNDATPTGPPDAPDQPSVVAFTSLIVVTFDTPSNGGSPITGYSASCASSDGGQPGANFGLVSPITVTGLTNGNTYSCAVTASNANGPGNASPPSVPAIPNTIPSAPAAPDVSATGGDISVAFTAPFNGGAPITNYTATCTSSDGTDTQTSTRTASPIDVAVTIGNTYSCTVFATNTNGDGPVSPPSANIIPGARPGEPAQPNVAPGNAIITVSFVPPDTGGSPITDFQATCAGTGALTGIAHGTGSPIGVSGLTNGKSYTCTVVASNVNGPGPASPASPAVVPRTVPGQVGTPSVVAGNAQITVGFSAPPNGGFPITQYRVTCASTNGGGSHTAAATGSPFVMKGLVNGAGYRCSVAAASTVGWGPTSFPSGLVIPRSRGFRMFTGDGSVYTFGDSGFYGSAHSTSVIAMTTTRDNRGYWVVNAYGAVFPFGDAKGYGSLAGRHLNRPIVGATATPSGHGYWLVASDGGIFAFGDAHFYGSTGNIRLNQPIVGMTATGSGRGYWFVAADGGLFGFGDARFFGSAAGRVNPGMTPIVGMATSVNGGGYWIAASDGRVWGFGNAHVWRSGALPNLRLPIRGIAATDDAGGFWLAAGDGGLFPQGDAPFIPWPGPIRLAKQIRGITR